MHPPAYGSALTLTNLSLYLPPFPTLSLSQLEGVNLNTCSCLPQLTWNSWCGASLLYADGDVCM